MHISHFYERTLEKNLHFYERAFSYFIKSYKVITLEIHAEFSFSLSLLAIWIDCHCPRSDNTFP